MGDNARDEGAKNKYRSCTTNTNLSINYDTNLLCTLRRTVRTKFHIVMRHCIYRRVFIV